MTARLLLDEHYASDVASQVSERGHDLVSVVSSSELRSRSDAELFRWAGAHKRRIVAENIKDFRPLLLDTYSTGTVVTQLLLVSSRRFSRGGGARASVLVDALANWLSRPDVDSRPDEDWPV